ncbi:hypothetical protein GCM10025777_46320 [Membranihabitans marinus]
MGDVKGDADGYRSRNQERDHRNNERTDDQWPGVADEFADMEACAIRLAVLIVVDRAPGVVDQEERYEGEDDENTDTGESRQPSKASIQAGTSPVTAGQRVPGRFAASGTTAATGLERLS